MLQRSICIILWVYGVCMSHMVFASSLQLTIADFNGNTKGMVTILLNDEVAPNHVERITTLANEGAYDGVVFHRVIGGFMAQTGDVAFGNIKNLQANRVGTGQSNYPNLKLEPSAIPFKTGVVGMARSASPHSANSQFFIMTNRSSHLDSKYTVIGEVVAGLDVVYAITQGKREENGTVKQPDYIVKAVIVSE